MDELAQNPTKGSVIPGGGGIRKIRLALENRGKSSGARVIYLYLKIRERIYLLTVYPKNRQENLTAAELKNLKTATTLIKKASEK